jgi:hypothetical protein
MKRVRMPDGIEAWVCHEDRIGIRVSDPLVGQWDKQPEVVCPACGSKMRMFCTILGFMKAKCTNQRCGASLTSGEAIDDAPQLAAAEKKEKTVDYGEESK